MKSQVSGLVSLVWKETAKSHSVSEDQNVSSMLEAVRKKYSMEKYYTAKEVQP